MNVTYEEMRDIAARLPVGYYMGRKVPVIVEARGGAYCDIVKCEIHIGMSLLAQAASHITAAEAEDWGREKLLRCVLYHEVGHVLLTPKWLYDVSVRRPCGTSCYERKMSNDILNIFEDERLERMLSAFFIGVDFNGFVHLVNGKDGPNKTIRQKFYNAVRLRKTTPAISAAVDDAIQSLVEIGAATDRCCFISEGIAFRVYASQINHLVKLILEESEEKQSEKDGGEQRQQQQSGGEKQQSDAEQEKPQGESGGESESGEDGGEDEDEGNKSEEKSEDADKPGKDEIDDGSNGEDEDESEGREHGDGDDDEGDADEETEMSEVPGESEPPDGCQKPRPVTMPSEALKALAGRIFTTPTPDVTKTLSRFAQRISKKKGTQAAGRWSALHGKIDTRRDAMDKDRIFRRSSDVGERLMSSVNLTLWVDVSGSFRASKDALNQILAATATAMKMSGGKLAANVVKMGVHASVANEHDWAVDPMGDNDIDESYVHAWELTRRRDRRNIDIVVFDGFCCTAAVRLRRGWSEEDVRKGYGYQLDAVKKMWNSTDCWIVSDTGNDGLFDIAAPKSHRTYVSTDYTSQLRANVIKLLDRIL